MAQDTKVITKEVRLSYARLITPKPNDKGKDVWSALLLIPKSDTATIAKLEAAAQVALDAGIANQKLKKGTSLKNGWTTLKDGDERDDLDEFPEYADHWYMNVNAYRRPGVIDRHKSPIVDDADIYSGCYARVAVSAYAFNVESNKGVTFGLENVQKLRDGEPLGGVAITPAADEFDDVDDDEFPDDEDDGESLL